MPALGLQHKSELNAFNLADDFIEPYRQIVDLLVYDAVCTQSLPETLSPEVKRKLVGLLCCQMMLDQRRYSLLAAIDRTIQSFQAAITENNPKLLKLPQMLPLKVQDYE